MSVITPGNTQGVVTGTTVGTKTALDVNVAGQSATIATPTTTTPTIPTATSTTILAANASRKYLLIQNRSAADIMVSLSGAVLTGIAPTSTNLGIVIEAGSSYESPSGIVSGSAITAYQTSGVSINTVVVVEA